MTDLELLGAVLARIDPAASAIRAVRRKGRVLLCLPDAREGAARALRLYQPQRLAARVMVAGLRGLTPFGLQRCLLPKVKFDSRSGELAPLLAGIEPGTCGVLLGSPEHRVRRAIASYRHSGKWEVAKISFGPEGRQILNQEAQILGELHALAPGAPRLLGLHHDDGITMMRMPYLEGSPIATGERTQALALLDQWTIPQPTRPITGFPEWPTIESALSDTTNGLAALARLSVERLLPVICHGDFARWNLLKQADGSLMVLDWEWGHQKGMPGIDLVHYFLQDARLVDRLTPDEAISRTHLILKSPSCREYLARTGWSADPLLPVIACLAYKQGAGHQDNAQVLCAALSRLDDPH